VVTARALTQLWLLAITTMEEALAYVAAKLGYESLKTEQKEAVKALSG